MTQQEYVATLKYYAGKLAKSSEYRFFFLLRRGYYPSEAFLMVSPATNK